MEVLRDSSDNMLGETPDTSPDRLHGPKDLVESLWNGYRGEPDVNVKKKIFENATQ